MSNPRQVMVVTDSTSDIPASLRDQHTLTIVPLTVTFGSESFEDGVTIMPPEFVERLRNEQDLPKTSQPSSSRFAEVFRDAIDNGMDVVCITISSDLSGTYNSASIAAEEFDPQRVRVVDSRSATMQLGWIVIDTARAVEAGADLDAAEKTARDAIERANCYAVLQTLDYVYKGGRIGRASHMVGSALGIKPVLNFVDGVLTPIERVRTWKRALARAIELASSTGTPTDIAILHADNLKDANAAADTLRRSFPEASIVVDWVGSTIGTYAGPGAIGIMTLSADS